MQEEILKTLETLPWTAKRIQWNLVGQSFEYKYPSNPITHELRLLVNRRDVEHDGYCSDPGEDTGEWQEDLIERYQLEQWEYDRIVPIQQDAKTIERLFPGEGDGGYCGYVGDKVIKKSWFVDAKYLTQESLLRRADEHRKKHGGTIEQHVISFSMRDERQANLVAEMTKYGLETRSKQAERFVEQGVGNLAIIIRNMIELKWCFDYCNMRGRLGRLNPGKKIRTVDRISGLTAEQVKQDELQRNHFDTVKRQILKEKSVPEKLPWL